MGLLLFGTVWFWIFCAVIIIAVTAIIEYDDEESHGTYAAVVLIIGGFLFWLLGKETFMNVLTYIRDNPWTILQYVGVYIFMGIIWSFWKWYIFLKNYRDHFNKNNQKYPDSYPLKDFKIPTYNEHFYRIVSWMMYWPFSALWTLTHKLIRDIFTFISDQLKLAYEKIAGRMFKDIIAEKEAAIKAEKEMKNKN
jgi:hypothetical protein